MDNIKKLSLFIILDAFVTKNAIEDFLLKDTTDIRKELSIKYTDIAIENKINKYVRYLKTELIEIESFLNDNKNIHWVILDCNKLLFDKNLPKHKRKIQWFHGIDRYPFDYSIFFQTEND